MRIRLAGAPVVVLATLLAACGSSAGGGNGAASKGSGKATTMRIAGNTNAAALPVWVAQDQGFFDKCGVEAKYTVVENITTLPAALGKSFDIALSVPPILIAAAANGIPIVEVAGATLNTPENPQTFLVVGPNSGIKSIKDLAGKTLGVQTITGSTHLGTKLWMKRAGVPEASVKIVQVDGPAQGPQLESGRIDAVETLAPFSTSVLKIGKSILDPQSSIAPSISGIFWTADRDWATKNSDAVSCFQNSLAKATDFIKANEEKAKAVLQKQTKLPADVVKTTVLPTYIPDVRPADLTLWENAMKEVGGFKGDVSVATLTLQH